MKVGSKEIWRRTGENVDICYRKEESNLLVTRKKYKVRKKSFLKMSDISLCFYYDGSDSGEKENWIIQKRGHTHWEC